MVDSFAMLSLSPPPKKKKKKKKKKKNISPVSCTQRLLSRLTLRLIENGIHSHPLLIGGPTPLPNKKNHCCCAGLTASTKVTLVRAQFDDADASTCEKRNGHGNMQAGLTLTRKPLTR